jgi:hypothetical protein
LKKLKAFYAGTGKVPADNVLKIFIQHAKQLVPNIAEAKKVKETPGTYVVSFRGKQVDIEAKDSTDAMCKFVAVDQAKGYPGIPMTQWREVSVTKKMTEIGPNYRDDAGLGYIAFYNGKKLEIRDAKSLYDATVKARERLKVPNSKLGLLSVELAEKGGKPVVHTPVNESLSVPEKHQLKVAIKTLKMPDEIANVMGYPNKEQAKAIYKKLTGKDYVEPKNEGFSNEPYYCPSCKSELNPWAKGIKHCLSCDDYYKIRNNRVDGKVSEALAKHAKQLAKDNNPKYNYEQRVLKKLKIKNGSLQIENIEKNGVRTYKLRDGTVVLAKDSFSPLSFTNRTQAQKWIDLLKSKGIEAYLPAKYNRPFYVALRNPEKV